MTNSLIESRNRFATAYPETRMVLNGRDWGLRDVGQGPALILIPGTLGRGDVFWNQIVALSDRLRIVAVSYPSSGGVAEWAEDIALMMDKLGIAKASVLGSSLGGYLAQYFAATSPDRTTRLIAANTLHSVVGLDQRMPYALDLQNAPIEDLRAGFGAGLGAWAEAHPDQVELVELLLQEAGGRILESELRARLSALKTGPELPAMPLPATDIVTIQADDDPLIPPEMRAAVRARLSPSVAYRFLDGGHFPYVARPADYTALLEQVMGLKVSGPDWGTGEERVL
ncbi:MAG: alpha/beta hydrolase [Rhizobiaceae bacterium]|nr:alpha/beta hydrolase [Rhizobiaceae bacterium]